MDDKSQRRGEPVAKVRERGFVVADGNYVPTVLVEFPVDDWESRDRFATTVDAPQPAEPVSLGRLLDAANAAVEILGSILDDPEAQQAADELSNAAAEAGRAPFVEPTQLGYTLSDVHEAYSRGRAEALKTQPAEPVKNWSGVEWQYGSAMDSLDRLGVSKSKGEDVLTLWGRIVEAFAMHGLRIKQPLVGSYTTERIEPVKMPSDRELLEIWSEVYNQAARSHDGHRIAFARALLARYGQPAFNPYNEPLVRFCPECGSLGDVPAPHLTCCPDGGHARMVPDKFAHLCRALFKDAIAKPAASAEPVGEVTGVVYTSHGSDPRVKWNWPPQSGIKPCPLPVGTKLYTAPVAAQPRLYDGDTLTAAYMAGQDSVRVTTPASDTPVTEQEEEEWQRMERRS